jgi:hypothetical protein
MSMPFNQLWHQIHDLCKNDLKIRQIQAYRQLQVLSRRVAWLESSLSQLTGIEAESEHARALSELQSLMDLIAFYDAREQDLVQ